MPKSARTSKSTSLKTEEEDSSLCAEGALRFQTQHETDSSLDNQAEDDAPRGFSDYEIRYIAFIDILGFKELVSESSKKDGKVSVSSIYSALDIRPFSYEEMFGGLLPEGKREQPEPLLRIHTFSDFVVASCPKTDEGFLLLTLFCWRIGSEWLSKEFLCRGGLTVGPVIHRTNHGEAPLVFGPAFIEAYRLESEVANYPRIVLSREARLAFTRTVGSELFAQRAILTKLIQKSEDGPLYVDLFSHLRSKGLPEFGTQHETEATQFSQAIANNLAHSSDIPHFFSKVLWLAKQFNSAIANTKYADKLVDSA